MVSYSSYSTEWRTFTIWRIMTTGIVALSFAKRVEEPNPVNKKLAKATDWIDDELQQIGESTVVVAQWEIGLALESNMFYEVGPEDATVKGGDKKYLDSQDVLNKAFEVFRSYKITDVVVVANPFLHKGAVESMVRKAGFNVVKTKIPWVGFDNSPLNLQWWCRGAVRFVSYLGLQAFGKVVRKDFHGIGEKSATS